MVAKVCYPHLLKGRVKKRKGEAREGGRERRKKERKRDSNRHTDLGHTVKGLKLKSRRSGVWN